jgi:two-component system, sensor histidine kinase FlrB
MPEFSDRPAAPDKAAELQRAFDMFNQVSAELTQAYVALQQRVASLTEELAVANGELRQQYREKEALSERLGLLLDALPAGVVVIDEEGLVSESNPAARSLLGEELVGAVWPELAARTLAATSTVDEWQCGSRRISLAESALDSAGGRLLLLHDLTAAHQMKAELERSQRLVAMGEMAASLAHQLRTPLASALLYSANLAQPQLGEEARIRFADKASAQLRRLERLIQDTLQFARGQNIGRDEIPVRDLMQEVAQTVEPLMRAHGVGFEVADGSGDAVLVGARKALFGALVNLLENALQVAAVGGCVRFACRLREGVVEISVTDDGPGIGPDLQQRIFEPFFTTRGQGTGLGLPIALGVARAHGGTIALESEPGQGARFAMILPPAAALKEDVSA